MSNPPWRWRRKDGVALWSFDLALWGVCVQAADTGEALKMWTERHGSAEVAELIRGDEQAFERDFLPATEARMRVSETLLHHFIAMKWCKVER